MKVILKTSLIISLIISGLLNGCSESRKPVIQGELMQWHRITLVFNGPQTSEMGAENPFLDYRLDVTFSKDGQSLRVPGL